MARRRAQRCLKPTPRASRFGSSTTIRHPSLFAGSMKMRPSCSSAIRLQSARPSPTPWTPRAPPVRRGRTHAPRHLRRCRARCRRRSHIHVLAPRVRDANDEIPADSSIFDAVLELVLHELAKQRASTTSVGSASASIVALLSSICVRRLKRRSSSSAFRSQGANLSASGALRAFDAISRLEIFVAQAGDAVDHARDITGGRLAQHRGLVALDQMQDADERAASGSADRAPRAP